METTPLISVVIPVYNGEKYIEKTINSIIKQEYKNIEILVINDGSVDDTAQVVTRLVEKDNRLRLINKKNAGVSTARNVGIDHSKGKYIAFVDGDDLVTEDYISHLYSVMAHNDVEIVASTTMDYYSSEKPTNETNVKIVSGQEAAIEMLYYRIPIGVYSKLFEADFLKKSVRFISTLKMGEGFNFNTTAFQKAKYVALTDKKIYHYRTDNPESVTTVFSMEKWKNGLLAIQTIKSNFIQVTPDLTQAWEYAWWNTNFDVFKLMSVAKVQSDYPDEFRFVKYNVKKFALRQVFASISVKRRIRAGLIYLFPQMFVNYDAFKRTKAMEQGIPVDGAIITLTTNNNYGNILQRWALQKFLKNNGYNYEHIYFPGYYLRQYLKYQSIFAWPARSAVRILKNKRPFFKKTASLYNYRQMSNFASKELKQRRYSKKIMKQYKNFIVGSDQVFNFGVISSEFLVPWKTFLLEDATENSHRISYAASFGSKSLSKDNPLYSASVRELMQKFNAISVREKSGIQIVKDAWNSYAVDVVDPTLLLKAQDYSEIIEKVEKTYNLFYFVLRDDDNHTIVQTTKRFATEENKSVGGIVGYGPGEKKSVGQWLNHISSSDLVITDSFHGVVFSIIFNTNFVVVNRTGNGSISAASERYKNLLDGLGISGRMLSVEEFKNADLSLLQPIDWNEVNDRLAESRLNSADWLLNNIKKEDSRG